MLMFFYGESWSFRERGSSNENSWCFMYNATVVDREFWCLNKNANVSIEVWCLLDNGSDNGDNGVH